MFRIKTIWDITSVSFGLTYHFADLHHIHENHAETLGCKYSIVNLLKNTKNMIIPMPISFSGSKINTFLELLKKMDVNQYIFPYTFNQTSAMTSQ